MIPQNPQSPTGTAHGICLQDLRLLLLSFIHPLFLSWTFLFTSSIPAGSTIQHIPMCQRMALGMWGLQLVGTAGNTILCLSSLATSIVGSVRTYEATHSVTDPCHRD